MMRGNILSGAASERERKVPNLRRPHRHSTEKKFKTGALQLIQQADTRGGDPHASSLTHKYYGGESTEEGS
jgi:hypothetical protein